MTYNNSMPQISFKSSSQSSYIKSEEDEKLNEILDKLDINGEITKKDHPLINYIKTNKKKLKPSKIKYSYIGTSIEWKEYKRDEDTIYLFRIITRIDNKVKNLIRNEFQIHKENEELNNICPDFICYYFSSFLNFSVFKFENYNTLEEILNNRKLVDFSLKGLLTAVSETINILLGFDDKFYICPFLTPSNLLYTESIGN